MIKGFRAMDMWENTTTTTTTTENPKEIIINVKKKVPHTVCVFPFKKRHFLCFLKVLYLLLRSVI